MKPTACTRRRLCAVQSRQAWSGVLEEMPARAGNARKLTQANDWKVTHPSGVLFFPMSVYDLSSPGLWEVCKTARVGGGGRVRRGAGGGGEPFCKRLWNRRTGGRGGRGKRSAATRAAPVCARHGRD